MALLALAALLPPDAVAQPHMQEAPDYVNTPTPDPGVWLGRLVGKFRFEGVVGPAEGAPASGTGDCVAIGTGPGVQCILNVTWIDAYPTSSLNPPPPGAVSYLDPAVILFGLDPGSSRIRNLVVDNKGLPEHGTGVVKGNVARFTSHCVNEPIACERIIGIEARPDARILYMWIEFRNKFTHETGGYIELSLRRVAQNESSETPPEKPMSHASRSR
jgi:hypothetical protein